MAAAWLVHLFTASGIVLAFLAAASIFEHDYRTAFLCLWLQVMVDAVDGTLARWQRVAERLPWFDGAKLDDITDYLTYVFVPALFVWRALLVPDGWAMPIAAVMLLSSAWGFARTNFKTPDHYFTGFPSYWNIVVFYMWAGGSPPAVNAAILAALGLLVFVPIRYVYPSRAPVLRGVTNVLAAVWAVVLLVMIRRGPNVPPLLFGISLAFPVYYVVLSLALQRRRAS